MRMEHGDGVAALTVGAVAVALALYERALPDVYAASVQRPTDTHVRLIRRNATHATIMAMAIGLGATALARSPWPVVGVAIVGLATTWQYNTAARLEVPQ